MTVEALEGLELTRKDAERAKNMFALGLLSWLYDRPTDRHRALPGSRSSPRKPLILAANLDRAPGPAGRSARRPRPSRSRYEVAPAADAARHLPQHHRQHRARATAWSPPPTGRGLPLVLGSYPITPASDILHTLSGLKRFGVTTMQAEDEIAAIGAALGAAYGGAIGVTTTSGPGLALKSETIGLAVSLELPLVVVDVQRGGPSHRPARPRPSRPTCCRPCSAATARRRCR